LAIGFLPAALVFTTEARRGLQPQPNVAADPRVGRNPNRARPPLMMQSVLKGEEAAHPRPSGSEGADTSMLDYGLQTGQDTE